MINIISNFRNLVFNNEMTVIQKTNRLSLTFMHCLTPLLIGGFIYISFRNVTLRMFDWCNAVGLKNTVATYRESLTNIKSILPQWFYYSLPDGLWVYSFSSALIIFWNNEFKKFKYWLLMPLLGGILIEILQGFKFFPGTFDLFDLFFSSVGLLLSKTIINHKFKCDEKPVF